MWKRREVKQKLICASHFMTFLGVTIKELSLVFTYKPIGWDAHHAWSPSLTLCVQYSTWRSLPVSETVQVSVQCTLLPHSTRQKVFGVNHTGACCVYPSPTARGVSLHIQAVSVAALSADRKSGMTKQRGDWHPSRPPRHSAWRCTHRWML